MANWLAVRQFLHSQFAVTKEIEGCVWILLQTPRWPTHIMVQNVSDVALVIVSNVSYIRDVSAQALMDASADCLLGVKRQGDEYVVNKSLGLENLAMDELLSSVTMVGEQAHTYVSILGLNVT